MEAYEQAAEWYSGEDSNAQANACLLKVAQFAGTLEQYDRAVELFERVSSKSLENNLTKWSVREYLFKSMICILCINVLHFNVGPSSIKDYFGTISIDGSYFCWDSRM
jgi:alpha-soluble NSF attachment protein